MTTFALWMVGLAFFFLVYEWFVRQLTCRYCGKTNGHEEHCPYAGSGLSGS